MLDPNQRPVYKLECEFFLEHNRTCTINESSTGAKALALACSEAIIMNKIGKVPAIQAT